MLKTARQPTAQAPQGQAHPLWMAVAVSTTRAIFYFFGITQPTAAQEKTVTAGFWGLVLALALVVFFAVCSVLASVAAAPAH